MVKIAAIPANTAESRSNIEQIYKASVTAIPVLITRGPTFTTQKSSHSNGHFIL